MISKIFFEIHPLIIEVANRYFKDSNLNNNMTRITYKFANSPIVFVAPHGHPSDDHNTDIIAKYAADNINSNLIINTGFKRNTHADTEKDVADCNNYQHCMQPEVKEEFLEPYVKICRRCLKYFGKCFVVWIHGVSDSIRNTKETKNLDMILGYGMGNPHSLSCFEGIVHKFISEMYLDKLECFVGKPGGKYSGFDKKNMNQYWRKIDIEAKIQSFQLEIIKELRADKLIAELTGVAIAEGLANSIDYPNYKLHSNIKLNYI